MDAANKRSREEADAALKEKIDDLNGEVQSLRNNLDTLKGEFANSAYDHAKFVQVKHEDMQEESNFYKEKDQFADPKYRTPRLYTLNQISGSSARNCFRGGTMLKVLSRATVAAQSCALLARLARGGALR